MADQGVELDCEGGERGRIGRVSVRDVTTEEGGDGAPPPPPPPDDYDSDEYDCVLTSDKGGSKRRRKRLLLIGAASLVACAGLGVGLGLGVDWSGGDESSSDASSKNLSSESVPSDGEKGVEVGGGTVPSADSGQKDDDDYLKLAEETATETATDAGSSTVEDEGPSIWDAMKGIGAGDAGDDGGASESIWEMMKEEGIDNENAGEEEDEGTSIWDEMKQQGDGAAGGSSSSVWDEMKEGIADAVDEIVDAIDADPDTEPDPEPEPEPEQQIPAAPAVPTETVSDDACVSVILLLNQISFLAMNSSLSFVLFVPVLSTQPLNIRISMQYDGKFLQIIILGIIDHMLCSLGRDYHVFSRNHWSWMGGNTSHRNTPRVRHI